jgi:hypothetical protein
MYACIVSFKSQIEETRYLAAVLNSGASIKPVPGTDRHKIMGLSREDFYQLYEIAQYFRSF